MAEDIATETIAHDHAIAMIVMIATGAHVIVLPAASLATTAINQACNSQVEPGYLDLHKAAAAQTEALIAIGSHVTDIDAYLLFYRLLRFPVHVCILSSSLRTHFFFGIQLQSSRWQSVATSYTCLYDNSSPDQASCFSSLFCLPYLL